MSTRAQVVVWLALTAAGAAFGISRLKAQEPTMYLPGKTSSGHRQIETACGSCHTPFGGVTNEACLKCHGDAREKADSHVETKFNDPRNADQVSRVNVRKCVTCHAEHWPEGTHREGYTLPTTFCRECHADVVNERPSHQGMSFDTCSDAGCHNYHDNRALWEDHLKKHIGEPPLLSSHALPERARTKAKGAALAARDQDAPSSVTAAANVISDWEASAHAKAGVNCTDCHGGAGGSPWVDKPAVSACSGCHAGENKGWQNGKHGMRLAAGLSPMSPALAELPMKAESHARSLDCQSCHASHRYDTLQAATAACLGCHDDEHSRSYKGTPHEALWDAEVRGAAPAGTGVSCAGCHMPRVDDPSGGKKAQHDQNDNLRPNDKMVRDVCATCHGMSFSFDAMADADLVRRNFAGAPQKHVASVDMVQRRAGQDKPR
jgi:hypothetical protein